MKKEWKILTILGIVTVTYGLYTWGIPAAVNIKSHKSYIEQTIKEKSGYIVDVGEPKLSMGAFPSVWIKSNSITLLNDDNSKALVIENPKLKLKLFPLLMKKIEIAKVSSTKEEVFFTLTKDSQFLIGQYPLSNLKREKSGEFTLSKMDLNIGEYNIHLDDKKNNQTVLLSGDYFKHGKYIHNKQVKFATKGILKVNEKQTDIFADIEVKLPIDSISEDKFKIDANIEDFDLASISDYVRIATNNRIKSLGGIVDFVAKTTPEKFGHKKTNLNLSSENLKIIGNDRASSVVYDDKLALILDFTTVDNGVHFDNAVLESDKIHLNIKGKVFDIGHKAPKYNIQAQLKDTRLEDVVAIFPWSPKVLPEFNLYNLKKYILYGNGNAELSFVGQGNRPHVNGYAKLTDAYLIHPIKNAPANITVDMAFKEQLMHLEAFGPLGNNQNVTVKGDFKIDGSKYSEIEVKSTDSVDLAPVQEVLVPLHEILNFQLGPVPLMKFSGLGNVDIRSAGKKIDPHLWGRITFRNATASFIEINNLVLNNGAGEVVFDDKNVTFKTYKAFTKGRPIDIHGDCKILGNLNVYVESKAHDIKELVKVINTSPILVDVQTAIKPFTKPNGVADVFLHFYGAPKNAAEVVFGEDLFAKGTITLHDATTVLQDTFLPFKKVNGVVNFDQYDSDYNVTGYVRNSYAQVYGTGSNSMLDLKAHSDKATLNDIFDLLNDKQTLPYQNEIGKLEVSVSGGYKGLAQDGQIDYDKVYVDGNVIPNIASQNPIRLDGGTFKMRNGFLSSSLLKGFFFGTPCSLSFVSKDLDKQEMNIVSADFDFKDFDISSINSIKDEVKLSPQLSALLNDVTDIKGIIDIKGTIKNNKVTADTNIANTSFVYKPFNARVNVLNGNANMRGTTLYLDKVNSTVSSMPVFLNGRISDVYSINPRLHLSISSKLTQSFFDRFYNSQAVYPVKLKGDVNFNTKLDGPLNALSINSKLNLGENASIYYMGATLAGAPTGAMSDEGLSTNPVSVEADAVLYPDRVKLNSLKYNQTITSQNKKRSVQNQLVASGDIKLLDNNLVEFKDLKVKTNQPTNARIFNVAFKKPTIKQGVFTSDLLINGTSDAPYILGLLSIKSVDIPVLDSTVRDISVDFKPDYIYLNSKSVVLTNDINMDAKIVNKPTKPLVVDDVQIQMDELDMNVISATLSDLEADSTRNHSQTDLSQMIEPDFLIINNGSVIADKIIIKKAHATNFKSHLKLGEDQVFNIDNYGFDIANGNVSGSLAYDLSNYKMSATMKVDKADAQIISENFFDLPGQMFGIVTGDLNASCVGQSSVDCINTLSGSGQFEVIEGKMPKLGSLEYLLKAGNLITGGITGVSINGIIDLITPLKTGDFKSIRGNVKVTDGVAHDINVYSSGTDLNMYMTGSYNIASLVADMEVYGSLSKNFSTILGKIGNSSLNTLFNTIPGIKINDINPKSTSNINKIPNFDRANTLRVFKAEIFGDINGSNYVKSFRWIKD